MEYNKIVSVTGLPGLFELLNTKSDGAIVRSLDDKTTRFASSRIHNFSHLETIEIYTVGDNVNLTEVFQAMEKNSGSLPDTKDNTAIRKYFEKEDILSNWNKSSWAKKLDDRKKRSVLTDFDRFKLLKLKKQVR